MKGDRHAGDRVQYLLTRSKLSKTWHNVILVKLTLTFVFVLVLLLPPWLQALAAVPANLLWLWRT